MTVLSGAGISAESGVPTFRDVETGLWAKVDPYEISSIEGWQRHPEKVWAWYLWRHYMMSHVQPNDGHRAVAAWQDFADVHVITQNVDNLHQASGVPPEKVIELHGNASYATCLECAERHELADLKALYEATGDLPACRSCGGIVKTATISFGQAMPLEAMARAEEATLACDLFLVLGSSLVVYPAAGFPIMAKKAGAALAIVNREPTELDPYADLVLHDEIGPVMTEAAPAN